MKIQKLETLDFKGLDGKRSYDLSSGIVALCQKNGSGKTSVIDALRFALAGTKTDEMVFHGQSATAVQIVTEAGNTYTRRLKESADRKTIACFFNGKHVSAEELNNELYKETHVPTETAKIASSGELLTSLTSQQFGDMLLSYLPEQLTRETVVSNLPNATESQIKIVDEIIYKLLSAQGVENQEDANFGTELIDKIYAELMDRRKALKKSISEKEAVVKQFKALGVATGTMESLEAQKAQLMAKRDAAVLYSEKERAYKQAILALDEYNAELSRLDAQIAAIADVTPHTAEEKEAVARELLETGKTGATLRATLNALKDAITDLRTAIDRIKEPVCPLSEKLVCKTDKTGIVSDLQAQGNAHWNTYQEQKKELDSLATKYNELQARLEQIDKDNLQAQQKQHLVTQREQLMKNKPVVPEEPAKAEDVITIDNAIRDIDKNIYILTNQAQCDKINATLKQWTELLKDYEYLVEQFSPKGAVKEAIMSYYLADFAETINQKAAKLFDNMTIKFINDKGVTILVDVRGTGVYLSYASLSGGEQACVMFLLLDLLTTLSGFGTIILDELSVLDNEVFSKLIGLVKEHEADYDLVLISCVDHDDTVITLRENNIPIIEC